MKPFKAPADEQPPASSSWLTTFNDMITLLLVFFVLMFTMSSIDIQKMKNFCNELQSALGVLKPGSHTPVEVVHPQMPLVATPSEDAAGNKPLADNESVARILNALDSQSGIQAHVYKRSIKIALDERLLFQSGQAIVGPAGYPFLDQVVLLVKALKGRVRIEGHTDNVPPRSRRYPSNWELSTARAVNVVKYFIDQGGVAPQVLSAVGYGDAKPIYPNDAPAHRAANRRVEIIMIMGEHRSA
jgi:chemotaxis protein MotB